MARNTKYGSDISRFVHETVQGLHRVGLVDEETMRRFDASCLRMDRRCPRRRNGLRSGAIHVSHEPPPLRLRLADVERRPRDGRASQARGAADRQGHDPGHGSTGSAGILALSRATTPMCACMGRSMRWTTRSAYSHGSMPMRASDRKTATKTNTSASSGRHGSSSGEEIAAWVYLYRGDVTGLEPIADGRWAAGRALTKAALHSSARSAVFR